MRAYGQWNGNSKGHPENPLHCIKEVGYGDRWPIGRQCSRKRGFGENAAYCKQHAKQHPAFDPTGIGG